MSRRDQIPGVAMVTLGAATLACTSITSKLAFRDHVGVATLVTVRITISALILWSLVVGLRIPRRLPPRRGATFVGIGLIFAIPLVAFQAALSQIPAAAATLLLYTYPALVAIITFLLGRDRIGWLKASSLVLALAGVSLVLGAPAGHLTGSGVTLALGAAIALSTYLVIVERPISDVHPILFTALVLTVATLAIVPVTVWTAALKLGVVPTAWVWILGGAVLQTVGITLLLASVKRIGPASVSIAASCEVLFTGVMAALVFNELPAKLQLVGAGLVLLAVTLLPLAGQTRLTPVPISPSPDRA